MEDKLVKLADEAIRLEYLVGRLYMIFRDAYPEDGEFWWQLVIEEGNHAALIKSGRDYFMPAGVFPEGMFAAMEDLQRANGELEALLEAYAAAAPSRETAFNTALKIETSAGEMHFQQTMTRDADSEILKLFQKLNQDDKDHARRIREYMTENGIPFENEKKIS